MKKRFIVTITVLTLLFAFGATAETFTYPAQNPLFSITFPNHWTVEPDEDLLHASPPDESIYLGLWVVEDADDIEEVIDALEESLSEMIMNVDYGDPTEFENRGIDFFGMDGTGVDEEGDPMNISIGIFTPDDETFCVFFYLGAPEDEVKYEDSLTSIILSIQAE